MFESHYDFILQYISIHYGCSDTTIELNSHLSMAIIVSTINELKSKGFVEEKKRTLSLTYKGIAYLEQKGNIVLNKEIQSRKRDRLKDLNKRSNKNMAMYIKSAAKRIKSISLADWAALAGIMSFVIAVFYIVKEILK